jgi:hypothetical protein
MAGPRSAIGSRQLVLDRFDSYCLSYVEEQAFQACVKTQNKRGFQPRCLRDTPTLEML